MTPPERAAETFPNGVGMSAEETYYMTDRVPTGIGDVYGSAIALLEDEPGIKICDVDSQGGDSQ